jgi:hypothetical protein
MSVKPKAPARRPNSGGGTPGRPLERFNRKRCKILFIISLSFFSATHLPRRSDSALDANPSRSTVVLEYFRPRQRQLLTLMTSKHWMLIALAVVLGSLSLYLNKDWFAGDIIQIHHRSHPVRGKFSRRTRGPDGSATEPVYFLFNRKLKLTSLKVIPVTEIETNKYPQPIWELVSDSNSLPVTEFAYGEHIRGMRPSVQGATPDPLEPDVKYRLLIEAKGGKAEHDFTPVLLTP